MTMNPYAPPHSDEPANEVVRRPGKVPIWNPTAACNWSLLFSPAFGAYIHALNWEALGEPALAAKSRIWFYVNLSLMALMISAASVVPAFSRATNACALGLLFAWYFASGKAQGQYVTRLFGRRYPKKSWTKPLLIGVGAFFGIAMVSGLLSVALSPAALSAVSR